MDTKTIIIGVLVIALLVIVMGGKKDIGYYTFSTLASCQSQKSTLQNQGYQCLPDCVLVNSATASCMNSVAPVQVVTAGQYFLMFGDSASQTCTQTYADSISKGYMNCLFGGIPGGTTCTASSWTPDVSTVCSGTSFTQTSNCGTTRSSTGTKSCSNTCFQTFITCANTWVNCQ